VNYNLSRRCHRTETLVSLNLLGAAHYRVPLLIVKAEQQPTTHAALHLAEVRKKEKDICTLREADTTAAEEVTAMKPIKVATLVMSEETTPTLSVVAPLLIQLIHDLQDSPTDSNLTKEIISAMCQDLKSYLNKETLYVAAAIDLRFKALPFLSEVQRQDVYAIILAEATGSKALLVRDKQYTKRYCCQDVSTFKNSYSNV